MVGVFTGGVFTKNTTTSTTLTIPKASLDNKTVTTEKKQVDSKTVKRLTIPESQVVYLTGVISNVQPVIEELKAKAERHSELYLLIDSPGGSVLDGALVLSAMEASNAKIHTVCIALCASMAFIIHQHGVQRLGVDRAMIMAHPASGGLQGTLQQMNSRLSTITRYVDKMDAYIAKRANMTLEQLNALSVSELWLDTEDALARNFIDGIVDVNTSAKPPMPTFFITDEARILKEKINLTW